MVLTVSIIGVAVVAFCVWLTVRIINRREKWAKWTLAMAVVGFPVTYVLSFGPACWIASRLGEPDPVFNAAYGPLCGTVSAISDSAWGTLSEYGGFWMAPHSLLILRPAFGPYESAAIWSRSQTFSRD